MSTIILFRGLPAAGKTFISDETGKILKTAIIRKDDITDSIQSLSEFIRERNGQLKTILCNCTDENLWEERFNQRIAKANDDNLLLDFKDLKKNYPNLVLEKFGDELVVDTSISLDENILGILNYVK